MKRIYEPENLLEAEVLLVMLASEGIGAHLQGRDLVGAMGELPAIGLLNLAVDDAQAERALALINQYTSALPVAGEEPDSGPGILLC
ncbi:putative signal transducing protein [Pseudomonas sp. NPDC007930]|uniref:putative signal transducing protein n=1 Tax=Pseudomonas sp. NPDC007930 TaxID=3364417 RepID=UPI0036E650F8